MGLANLITMVRVLAIPVFMVFLLSVPEPFGPDIAAVIFIVAAITDTLDGWIARAQSQVTVFGKLMDPLADKLLVSAALICLVELGRVSAWPVVIIIAREFAVSGLRLIALTKNMVISASSWGKIKTVSQVVAISAIILDVPLFLSGVAIGTILLYIAVILTIISGIDYFYKARGITA